MHRHKYSSKGVPAGTLIQQTLHAIRWILTCWHMEPRNILYVIIMNEDLSRSESSKSNMFICLNNHAANWIRKQEIKVLSPHALQDHLK